MYIKITISNKTNKPNTTKGANKMNSIMLVVLKVGEPLNKRK